jgi:DNA-binding NtrC family response regulator
MCELQVGQKAMLRHLERTLVVEDDVALRAAIVRILTEASSVRVSEAGTAAEAKLLLSQPPPPDLLIIDVRLPDGPAFEVLELASRLSPAPLIIAMSGKASPDETFRLAQLGVRKYLSKPFSIQQLLSTVETARREVPDYEPVISAWVGRVPMRELQQEVRRVMVKEALAQTEGSRSGAARLLKVTRQAVQQMLRSDDPSDGPTPLTKSPGDPTSSRVVD